MDAKWWVMYPKDRHISSQAELFYTEKKSVGNGFGIQEKD